MGASAAWLVIISVGLVLGNAFFVAAEYALVSSRRSSVEAMAKKGHGRAKLLLAALQDVSPYVAGVQVAITMFGIGVGSVTEPFITRQLTIAFGPNVSPSVGFAVSFLIVTFLLVVVGELVPKYLSLQSAEKVALITITPLTFFVTILKPLIWLVQTSGALILRLFGVRMRADNQETLPREELLMLIKTGGAQGILEKVHAEVVGRALKLDALAAKDIMIHRLDVQWMDVATPPDQVLSTLAEIPHTRVPVCRGDIDEVVGIVYIHDVLKALAQPDFNLENIVRAPVIVPESLTLDRIVLRMREEKSQILLVVDEYGGTSGLITLEDVVEEVFGELEDRLESERPPIEVLQGHRISARADVRFDELLAKLEIEVPEEEARTDTLATMIVEELERIPRIGDSVGTPLGVLKVENMARSRITRVSLLLDEAWRKEG